ncbi:MAG: hypothetical protein A3F43_03360 [Gammaproteobacteria bacterium RIFCSPHIGHO2_12_FULL_42_10]|nr:MAG: hypothetical protein A3F43_03360 [Gammaproteobacteria bacterium RIFCSPHIGHO2_12_FULL_42_10]
MTTLDITTQETIYTVSKLNQSVRSLLEDRFPWVWVEGEISNFSQPSSGHWYFSLKDPSAQVRCAMFRGNQRRLAFAPTNGLHVLVKAHVSLYENRGEFQLIIDEIEERGIGKLYQEFNLLKNKLEKEGLFNSEHKKSIPIFPKQIGIVTSSTGAAVRDILIVLRRRCPNTPVIIYPALVQGATASKTIVQAIQIANQRKECDVLILARGGGSLEDLWPFNEEIVARAIYTSQIPTISGIGHEVDFTIADFVADKRAPTPSAAAEMASTDKMELLNRLSKLNKQLSNFLKTQLLNKKQQLLWINKHLLQNHPKRRLSELVQKLDHYEKTFIHLMSQSINKKHSLLTEALAKLDALSPEATLKRGFSITTDANGRILSNTSQLEIGSKVNVRLALGSVGCLVESKTD